MRLKKQKRHRKVVRFYTACFGFREPYKVLVDGTFVQHLIAHRLLPADDSLSHLLGARARLFSTSCITAELRTLGESYFEAFQASRHLITARCDHEKRVSASSCIQGVVAEDNQEHFFVATQDPELRKKLREIPGIPVIYAVKNSLFIEKPSSEQREFVKASEEGRLHASESEKQLLRKKALQVMEDSSSRPDDIEEYRLEESFRKSKAAKKSVSMVDRAQFKRNRAKGPNPLSCKKKKVKESTAASGNQDGPSDNVTKKKRIRKRKKSNKDPEIGGSSD